MLIWNEARNQWEGDAQASDADIVVTIYNDLPNPANVPNPPAIALVFADPIDGLNGLHWTDGRSWRKV